MMTGSIWTLAFLFLTMTLHAAEPHPRDPHIRSTDTEILNALASGARLSPTLRRLVDRLEASDVVVYVTFDRSPAPRTAGHIAFVTSVPGRRYLQISVDRRNGPCPLIAILGHELQHAVEIADEPAVTGEAELAALYRRIGFRTAGDHHAECFDSNLAIATGQLIQREVQSRYTEFTDRRHGTDPR
jgi:hypothetical protein